MLFAAKEQHRLGIGVPPGLTAARQRDVHGESHAGSGRRQHGGGRNHASTGGGFQHCRRSGFNSSTRLRHRPFLLGFSQGFVNSAHSFPSLVTSRSDSFNRSAKLEMVFSASTKSNLSGVCGSAGGIPTWLSPRSKSRATASTMPTPTTFCWSTNALTRQCSQIKFTTRGIPLE